MARPERHNADYFPFYAKDGRTLFLLESKYKCKGTGFFTNVMRFLTLETNHYVDISDETDRLYFFSKCFCEEESALDMLNIMSKTGKIDKDLWAFQVVVSQDLLDSLEDAYRNRKNDIITIPEIKEKYVSSKNNPVSDVENGITYVEKPQRKGKEIKGKEIKGKEILSRFDKFWSFYPKKKSKGTAEKAWLKIKPTEQLLEIMLTKITQAKASHAWQKDDGEYIPYPATWLNAKGWEDEYLPQHPLKGVLCEKGLRTVENLRSWTEDMENAKRGKI